MFEEHGFVRTLEDDAPVLDVELYAFEELRSAPGQRAARVELKLRLSRGRDVVVEETIGIERPLPGARPSVEVFVHAMAQALDEASLTVAARAAATTGQLPSFFRR